LGGFEVEPAVLDVLTAAVARFSELGCEVEEVQLDFPDLGPAQQVIVLCEANASIGPRREEWEQVIFPATRKLLPNSDRMTYQDLIRAHWARDEYAERVAPLFDRYDALLTPVTPIPPTLNGTLGPKEINGHAQRALFWLNFVVPFNMTGQPAASLPVGRTSEGLPVGLQLVGRRFDEWTLLQLASAYEQAFPWTQERPPAAE
jgi:aspartyl-tRNA(Asn)/glutamyl-tRNA(Gln) amidotransferase subunit A